jgi:Zn-dependent protease
MFEQGGGAVWLHTPSQLRRAAKLTDNTLRRGPLVFPGCRSSFWPPFHPPEPALLEDFLLALPMLLFALVAHEFAHGWAAYRQGDDTAYKLGRLTLNPIPHIDPILTIVLPVMLWFLSKGTFTFGGARPVPVVTRNFRNFRRGDLIVSSAGIAMNLVLALAWTTVFAIVGEIRILTGGLGTSTVDTLQRMLVWGIQLNLVLAFFNLIPIPPLDGSRLLYHFLPPALGARYRSLDRFGFLLVIVLIYFFRGAVEILLFPASWGLTHLVELVLPFAAGNGWNIFQQ